MSPASVRSLPVAADRRTAAAPGLEALRRLEAELESEWERLARDGHGASGVKALLAGKQDAAERARSLAEADAAQQAFLARLDDFQRRLHAHFMAQVEAELERAVEMLSAFYGRRRVGRLRREHRRLVRLAERYRTLEPLYGTARDHRRIAVYQRFYARVVAFSERIRRLDPTAPASLPPSVTERLSRAGRALAWRVRRVPTFVRLVVAALRLVATALSKKNPETGTPFTNRVDAFFRALGALRGYEVHVSGHEHLERPVAATTVSFFAPAHRHGVTDNITFSHLELPDYLVFSAVDQLPGVPRFLKERVARTRGLVAVGGGRGSSVERALEALAQGVSRNILIYPEGSVSEGFRGTRPPRANFGEGLVRRIREAGYGVRLVPITYPDNARFLDLPPRSAASEARRLRVAVAEPLETPAVDALLAAGGGAMLNRVLRLDWLESLVTDEELFLGHDRVAAIERRLDLELDGIRYWGSLEPVPVRDRLAIRGDDPIRVYDEPFYGKRVRVLEIPRAAREPDDKIVLPDLQDPASRELLIGIRAPSHIYLAVGRTRFDGDIFRPLRVRERDYVYPGIVIRFVGVPVKSIHAISRKLGELSGREYRTLTCANSACQVIARAANLEIDDHAELRPFVPSHVLPTRTIRKIIERGVRSHSGQPLEHQIYKADDRSLEQILAGARREEIRIARAHVEAATLGAWRATLAALRRLVRALYRRLGPR